jgi:hypothetical protein
LLVYEGVDDVLDSGKKKKKKDKVRSAWIAFVGRIVAQLVGAIATVALGVMVLSRYTASGPRPPALEPNLATYSEPAVTIILIAPAAPAGTGNVAQSDHPSAEATARQAEVARAIAKAMSGALPLVRSPLTVNGKR